MGHLVDDAHADPVQHVIGNPGPLRRHKIVGRDAAKGKNVFIGAAVAHDTDASGIGKDCEILAANVSKVGLGDLLPEDEVRLPENVQLLLRHIPQ